MTRVALDTSVLVAGLVASHPDHPRAAAWLDAAGEGSIEALVCTHGLAETWATLTAMPLHPRLGSMEAEAIVERLTHRVQLVPCDADTYRRAIRRCAEAGRTSGAVFDALHVLAAEQAAADVLLTFNERDFVDLSRAGVPEIRVPRDPPLESD